MVSCLFVTCVELYRDNVALHGALHQLYKLETAIL